MITSNHKLELKVVYDSLKAGLIDSKKALELIDDINFLERTKDILTWGKYYFPHKFNLPFCHELHDYLISIRHDDFTSTYAPRGYAKTTISCFLIPIYQAYNEPDVFRHYLNVQSTASKAIEINVAIKSEIENNELLIRDYGDMIDSEKWTAKRFVLKNGVIFSAEGFEGSIRGMNYKNNRPDYIILDDLYNDNDINNFDQIKAIEATFWGTIYKAVAKTSGDKKVCIHVQGTAIHRNDLISKLGRSGDWKYKKFQAIKDYANKLVLWPEVESFDKLMMDKKNMGSIIFNRELMNDARADEDSIIKEEWIKTYTEIPQNEKVDWIRMGIDPAIGEKKVNDFTAKVGVIKTNLGNFYVFMAKNDKLSKQRNIESIKRMHSIYKFDMVKLEAIAAFQYLGQDIRRETDVPLRMIKTVKDKLTRLENISMHFESGNVYISKDIDLETRDYLIEQLINNKPSHDDLRDALILCLEEDQRQLSIA